MEEDKEFSQDNLKFNEKKKSRDYFGVSFLNDVCSVGLRNEEVEMINVFWSRQLLFSGCRILEVEWLVKVLGVYLLVVCFVELRIFQDIWVIWNFSMEFRGVEREERDFGVWVFIYLCGYQRGGGKEFLMRIYIDNQKERCRV